MFDATDMPVYVRPGKTDGRKSIDGLVGIIRDGMRMDVLKGGLFIFCNKARTTIKCISWDKTGFLLIQKKLLGYTFAWPQTEEAAKEISGEEFLQFLNGADVFRHFTPWEDVHIVNG
ncbi:MAG: IS66 family insertion sequence element accessory protein TnpB [Sphaerochaetaceae bacterium]